MDWKQLEETFVAESEKGIQRWMKRNPKHHAYAFAFHECYRELDGAIAFPWLGVNSVEKLAKDEDCKWSEADWVWQNILPSSPNLKRLEAEVFDEANKSTQEHWYRTEKRFITMMVRVTKALYRTFAGHPQTTDDLIVYFGDEDGDVELVRRCISKKLWKKHFSFVDEAENAVIAVAIEDYFKDPYSFEKQILEMGADAIEPLCRTLSDPENGWCAASLLGDLGIGTKQVIKELRKAMKIQGSASDHSARSLSLLGDNDYLFRQLSDPKKVEVAATGILAGLQHHANDGLVPITLDYRPVERLLEMKTAKITRLVNRELKPGSCFIQIRPSDVGEAIRGLDSRHTVVRQHAVCVLGERGLGKAVGEKALPKLAERLHDKVANVRRLTLLSLSYWKAAAKPYHAAMRKLQRDKDARVREYARHVFR
ncbi:hypothetical protein CA13_19920 [Planctomycetes bacterium CA13]|uniref:HEAT repeat protein n=1 Tax=Novipirellula herctigrandis TaxID=2527986 RepID=A0A5C5Z116_9BACT|nr:hypothetical protein CA13_19920 [Planctomycetes bacterium CA13]